MPNTTHGATNVATEPPDGKRFRPSREFYLACRGGLIARDTYIAHWASERGYTRTQVEAACYGVSNSPLARKIRAELADELGLVIVEDDSTKNGDETR